MRLHSHKALAAVDSFSLSRSLNDNQLCGLDYVNRSTYTAEGIIAITEMLKVNSTLQSIRCVRGARSLTMRQ